MKKFLTKNNLCLILLAILVFNFLFLPLPANAAGNPVSWLVKTFFGISADVLLFISSGISAIIGAFFGLIIYLEAQIIDFLLSPTNFPMTSAKIVTVGWGITRDLANMFFILILLIIAFATVLRIQSYAIKQLWWKLVVAALLVNFSLVIAGFVIDFTNVLTQFFLAPFKNAGVTSQLMANMQILNFYNPARADSILGSALGFTAGGLAAVMGVLLTLVGVIVTAFVFGAAAVFLIVRVLNLWLLLIFAPLAWMLLILPATSNQFFQWWHNFLKWTFFAPIFAFMIYLSTQIFNGAGKMNDQFLGALSLPANWTTAAPGLTTAAMPAAIFQWILVIAMMFGSLIVAQKFGVAGASGSIGILKGWGTGTKNWAGRKLRSTVLGIGAKEAAPGVAARPGLLVQGAQKLAAVPGGRLLANQLFKMTTAEAGTIEASQKQFAGWTSQGIETYLKKSPGIITNQLFRNQQMGAALALKEKGDLEDLGEARIRELAALASRYYSKREVGEILKVAPHLAPEFKEGIKKTVGRIDKADDILIDSLKHTEVVSEFSPQQLQTMVQKAGSKKVAVLKDTIQKAFDALVPSNQLNQSDMDIIKEFIIGKPGKPSPSRETRNKALRELAEKNPYAEKIVRAMFTIKSPAWQI